jgi:hypothetical protein
MESPPSYHVVLARLQDVNKRNQVLEQQNKDLIIQLERLKDEVDKVKYAYTVAKKNEVLLTSILQSKI